VADASARQERRPVPPAGRSADLPESGADDDGEYVEDGAEDAAFVEGFRKAFWYVLAEIDRKTTVDEILSWFAGRGAFTADKLRAFVVPDYDEAGIENLKRRLGQMAGR
jgi:hypothetical protein